MSLAERPQRWLRRLGVAFAVMRRVTQVSVDKAFANIEDGLRELAGKSVGREGRHHDRCRFGKRGR